MIPTRSITIFVLLMVILSIGSCRYLQETAPQFTQLKLDTPTKISQTAQQKKYFSTTIPDPENTQILLITLSSDIQSYLGIYITTSQSPQFNPSVWPDWNSYTQQCFYSSLDTCAIKMPSSSQLNGKQLLVYYTVTVSTQCQYTIDVSLEKVYQVSVGKKYSVNFANVEAAVLELSGSGFGDGMYEMVVVNCEYFSYRDIGRYQLLAKQGEIPNPGNWDYIRSKSVNGFTQILQLPPPKNTSSSYFILLQGQNSTRMNFTIKGIQSLTNPSLQLNQSVTFLTKTPVTYSISTPIPFPLDSNTTILPITISLYQYRGYGKFQIDYCNGLYNYSFVSTSGQSGEIVIQSQFRQQCFYQLQESAGLLIENLEISVTDVLFQFGYTVVVDEGQTVSYLIVGVKQMGILQGLEDQDTFDVAVYGNTQLTLTAQVYVGTITVSIFACQKTSTNTTKCTQQASTSLSQWSSTPVTKLPFTCKSQQSCQVSISQPPQSASPFISKYSLLLSYTETPSTQLQPNLPQYDIVQMNSYQYYYINVTQLRQNKQYNFSNATVINVRCSVVNGEVVVLASTDVQFVTFQDLFKQGKDVMYGFQGSVSYVANLTYPQYIYVGVLGDAQSLYHIQYTVNTSANIPSAYLDLLQNNPNNFQTSQSTPYILLKYKSHIIPYSITFDPMPSCIKYGTKLPISNNCIPTNSIPNVFRDQVLYFNVSQTLPNSRSVFKFSVFVNSGQYLLEEDRPLLVACENMCYEIVSVVVGQSSATILHSGDGSIKLTSTNASASNGPLVIPCASPPCQVQLNCTLKYGGTMTIAYQSSSSSQIQWRTKPISLPSQTTPKQFYIQVHHYSDFTSLIFYAQAADLTVYYNLIVLDQKYTNTVDYEYPTADDYDGVSYGDPLSEIHVVDVDESVLEGRGCRKERVVCVVTVSVFVNGSVEYSAQYVSKGLLYYSSNTYQYHISPKQPIRNLKQSYSLSYFTHPLNYSTLLTSTPFTIHIQSSSNCRPQIQIQPTNYMTNYYTDITLPKLLPGQHNINYRVITNQVCMYSTGLTNTGYQLVFPNLWQVVEVGMKVQTVVVSYQHDGDADGFRIVVKEEVEAIIVNSVQYALNPYNQQYNIIMPSIDGFNVGYSQNSTTLTISSPQQTQYLILIKLHTPTTHQTFPILIQLLSQPTTILHNQQLTYTYNPSDNSPSATSNPTVQYNYYTTNKFYVFVTVNKIAVNVTVRDDQVWTQDAVLAQKVFNNQSEPWLYVGDGDEKENRDDWDKSRKGMDVLRHYRIVCQFVGDLPAGSKAVMKLHVEEVGVNGLIQVYEGVSIYDAFVHENAMNCYKFVSPMILGEQTLDIDITFMKDIPTPPTSPQFPQSPTISSLSSLTPSSTSSSPPVHQVLRRISTRTYRQTVSFFAASTYKLCFILQNPNMIGVEYSLIVNSPAMPMVYVNQYQNESTVYGDVYDVFEYVNFGYQGIGWGNGMEEGNGGRVLVTVVNCLGDSDILGSSQYNDVMTGKLTDLTNSYKSNGVTSTLTNVKHGYYYFGIKAQIARFAQLFRLNIQQVSDNIKQIPQSQYAIDWSRKSTLQTIQTNNTEYAILKVPPVVRVASASSSQSTLNTKIVYSLYLLNLKNSTNSTKYLYSIDAYTRCPYLFTINISIFNKSQQNQKYIKQFVPIQTVTVDNAQNNNGMVSFTMPVSQFQKQSNISIKAEVYLTDKQGQSVYFNYYYGQAQIEVYGDGELESGLWRPIKWIFFIVTVIVAIGGCAFLGRGYLQRRHRNVQFEMSTDMSSRPQPQPQQNREPRQQETQESQQQRQSQPVHPDNNTQSIPSNRRPLNRNAGYGQFVDQII